MSANVRRNRTARVIGLTTALALSGSIGTIAAAPGHAATVTAAPSTQSSVQRTATLDGVPLTIASPVLSRDTFQVSQPGDLSQSASVMQLKPYRDFAITAVPYGEKLFGADLPPAAAGVLDQWRTMLTQADSPTGTSTSAGPTASLFGQTVASTITHRQDSPDGKTRIDITTVRWVIAAGNRLWIVEVARDSNQASAGFGSGMTVSSTGLANPTTVGVPTAAAPIAAPAIKPKSAVRVTPNAVSLGGTLPTPSWWNGQCDSGNASSNGASGAVWNLGSSSHALTGGAGFMGMPACGPTDAQRSYGSEPLVHMPGTAGYEWECAELSARYMILRYGTSNPGEYGSTAANNFYNSYGKANGFSLVFNGTAGQAPQAGDVISWDAPSSNFGASDSLSWGTAHNGHTAVVTGSNINASGTGTISILQQNYSETGTGTIAVNNWVVQSVMNSPVGTINWLHNPADGGSSIPSGFTVTIDANGTPLNSVLPVSGTVNLTAMASSANVINSLTYTITGPNGYSTTINGGAGATNYAQTWNTSTLANGTYTIQVTANEVDNQPHSYPAAPISFTVANNSVVGHASTIAANGTLVSFQIRADGNIYETNQTGPAAGFSNWASLSTAGGLVGMPSSALSPGGGGTVSVLARTTDGHIAVFGQSGPASGFSSGAYIGTNSPTFAGDPAVTLGANGTLVVFAVDTNGDLWEINQTGVGQGFGAWGKLSSAGGLTGMPTAILSPGGGGTVSVYARTTDGHIAVFGQSGPASGFSSGAYIGTNSLTFAGDPAVTLGANGTMVVFAVDTNGDLWEINQTGVGQGFNAWGRLSSAGGLTGAPSAALSAAGGGTVSVFARTTDGHIAVFGQSGPASGFSSGAYIGSNSWAFAGDPSVSVASNGTMVVFASTQAKSAGTQYGINQSSVGSGFGGWWFTANG